MVFVSNSAHLYGFQRKYPQKMGADASYQAASKSTRWDLCVPCQTAAENEENLILRHYYRGSNSIKSRETFIQ